MDKIDKSANDLIMIAYKTGGRIPYHYTDKYDLTSDELHKVNSILRQYGTFEGKLFEQWEWYELDDRGLKLCEDGGYSQKIKSDSTDKVLKYLAAIGGLLVILEFVIDKIPLLIDVAKSLLKYE